jgi:hypothetical protein
MSTASKIHSSRIATIKHLSARHSRARIAPFCALMIALVFALRAAPAAAQTSATSSAFGESVSVQLVPLPLVQGASVTSGPLPVVSGTAAPPYNQTQTTASVSVSASGAIGQVLQTSLITVHATADVPNSDTSSADSTVDNLSLGVLSLLNVAATTVRSTANIGGSCGSGLTRTGSTTIENGSATSSLQAGLQIISMPAANTDLINLPLLGIRVRLNEQITTGDLTTSAGITVNAVHIMINNFLVSLLGTLNADIIIAQSKASLTCGLAATPARTATATASRTNTPIPPTATRTPTSTNTAPPTATRTETPCSPAPSAVTSSAFGESIRLTLLGGVVSLASGPTPTAAGTAGAPYDDTHQLASAQLSSGLIGQILNTGLLIAHAKSDGPAAGASADATVNNLDLDITALLGLGAATIKSEASLTGCVGNFDFSGQTTIEHATLSGVLAGRVIALHPAPNTELIDDLGIRIVLNEQLTTPTSLTVNAIHIVLSNFLLGTAGLVSADIVIAQSVVGIPSGTFPTASATPTRTATSTAVVVPPTATRTNTPVPPTATRTATNTAVPATVTRTNSPAPPTTTRTATNTAVPPTATRTGTNTPLPPTATRTATFAPGTATRTATQTPIPPTATRTATNTAVPPTATRTTTLVPPTATRTSTATAVPATATRTNTSTPVPPTATRTNTPVPPTATRTGTNTPLPPTATRTATFAPGTATQTATHTAVPPTATNTAVPPSATRTNTPAPPTATRTATFGVGTAVPATATNTAIPPTSTRTAPFTAVPSTATQTATAVLPTTTGTATDMPLPPTATGTATSTPSVTLTPTPSATYTPTPCMAPLVESSAFGEMVDLNVGPIDGDPFKLTSARSPLVRGSAPPSYSRTRALPLVDMTHPMTGELLRTQNVSVSASGDVGEVAVAEARSDVDTMQLHITELSNLLSLRAASISSTASVEGTCCTGFTATGSSSFEDGSLDCLIGVGLPIDPSPAPNTAILDGVGMRIVLNEQIVDGDAHKKLGLTVNAVHIHLEEVLITGLGSLSGDIYFGQSKASLDCEGQIGELTCAGDCDRNGTVVVHELVLAVSIALGKLPMSSCDTIDDNPQDQRVAINELIEAVSNALYGCPEVRSER